MLAGPALTDDAARRARSRPGAALAAELADRGVDCLVLGEIGIGNTATTAALACALTGASPGVTVGRGTGLDAAGAGAQARGRRRGDRAPRRAAATPAPRCAAVGGLELAALAGAVARGRARGGCRSSSTATRSAPPRSPPSGSSRPSAEVLDRRATAPRSPATTLVLAELGLEPLLDLRLRLGEASGALLALPIVAAAGALHREMATFEEAGVDAPRRPVSAALRGAALAHRVPHDPARPACAAIPARRCGAAAAVVPARRRARRRASPARVGYARRAVARRRRSPRSSRSPCSSILTGALHQDGLADCADGLGVRGDRERRLAVMRDSAIGVFGTLALVGCGCCCWSRALARPRPRRRVAGARRRRRRAVAGPRSLHADARRPRTPGRARRRRSRSPGRRWPSRRSPPPRSRWPASASEPALAALAAAAAVAVAGRPRGRGQRSAGAPATRSARRSRSPRSPWR